ncbi:hypothetical protein DIPPA_18776 [Diplonema papillatum]|nr:hypothetical protein DIPPA_18776 [Diplonema papillatum]
MSAPSKGKDVTPFTPLPPPEISTLYSSSNVTGSEGRFYVTTAINYTNGPPHIGHAYEALLTDVIARYHRSYGRDVFFLTGTDEHGQKIAASAALKGVSPKELCDTYVKKFQDLNRRLLISNDDYVRTTDAYHEEHCRALWKRCADKGDIYLNVYEGWYDVKEEMFVPDSDAQKANFKGAAGQPLTKVKEAGYFFRLKKYQQKLVDFIKSNPAFITPEARRSEVLAMLCNGDGLNEDLNDLCISRTTFDWGVKLPEGFESNHVMYVWFDALTNYISGTRYFDESNPHRKDFWPTNVHVVGKDITRFHCIYWPAMLWSAGLELPHMVAGHGFVLDAAGVKMSKALNNVTDPHDILDKYPSDSIRYFMCNEAAYGSDLKCSEKNLADAHNLNLANTVGNLAQRAIALVHKYYDGKLPEKPENATLPLPFDLDGLRTRVEEHMAKVDLKRAVMDVMAACSETNNWITQVEPWKMKEDKAAERQLAIRLLDEAVYALAHFLAAFMPVISTCIFNKLAPGKSIAELKPDFSNLPDHVAIPLGAWMPGLDVLFPPIASAPTQAQPSKPAAKKTATKKVDAKEPSKDTAKQNKDAAKSNAKASRPPLDSLPAFNEDGWRDACKTDFEGRMYLNCFGDAIYPVFSGTVTFSSGSFDQTVYSSEDPSRGVVHTERGGLSVHISRTGGLKFNEKESKVTLKPHHSTNASEVKADGAITFCARVSKKGVLELSSDSETTQWVKKRQI